MIIEVYKCKTTGKLFEMHEKSKYLTHIRKVRKELNAKREYAKIKTEFKDWLDAEKDQIAELDEIVPWVLKNQKHIMKAYNAFGGGNWGDKAHPDTDTFTKLTLTGKYSDSVPNTHSCPSIGVTNWGGRVSGAPRGYPGYHCRIEGTLIRDKKHNGSYPANDIMKLIGIHTSTGGGGNESWGYSAEVFLADWPGLERTMIVNKLKGIS